MKVKKGVYKFRLIAYKEKKIFKAVCLDLDLYAEGRTLAESLKRLDSAVSLYVESVFKDHNGDEKLLDRPASKKYWNIYELLKELDKKKKEEKYTEGGIFSKLLNLQQLSYA